MRYFSSAFALRSFSSSIARLSSRIFFCCSLKPYHPTTRRIVAIISVNPVPSLIHSWLDAYPIKNTTTIQTNTQMSLRLLAEALKKLQSEGLEKISRGERPSPENLEAAAALREIRAREGTPTERGNRG